MVDLTLKQRDFFGQMRDRGGEFERNGVALLLKREDFPSFFDALLEYGLLDASRNPGPVEAETAGYFHIPYWPVLDYLKAAAKRSGETNDPALARKVLDLVADVTRRSPEDAPLRDNYHTANAFAEILGLVPTTAVTMEDIDLIPRWFGGKFDRTFAGSTLAGAPFKHFVESDDPRDWAKACRILRHGTELHEVTGRGGGVEPQPAIDDHWLKTLIQAHARSLGVKCKEDAVTLFVERLGQVFTEEHDAKMSWSKRPAIEEHEQNHRWEGPINRFVEGLRESLIGWSESAPENARAFTEGLLRDGSQISRRIAIHVINERFELWHGRMAPLVAHIVSDTGHIHEGYRFLNRRFSSFSLGEKEATVSAIRRLAAMTGENAELRRKRLQQRWLSSIRELGSDEADDWFAKLSATEEIGSLGVHPDFLTYHTSHSGFGDSPLPVEQLVDHANQRTLIDYLNSFNGPGESLWEGPSVRGLADMLEIAVAADPNAFLAILPQFANAARAYQFAVIDGFKALWGKRGEGASASFDWTRAWPQLISFFETTITPTSFWDERVPDDDVGVPTRDWIPGIIAEFLRAGVRNDETAFDSALLPRTWALVEILLARSPAEAEPADGDAMTSAINSTKGKAIEAMVDHALRACRVEHARENNHDDAWAAVKPAFDREIALCRGANFEFSTLAAAYLAQIKYLSARWYEENFGGIFPTQYPSNCLAAVDGLAFAPATNDIYASLVEAGVIDWALHQDLKGRSARERLLERMALAHLWSQDTLDAPRFALVFDGRHDEDISDVTRFFWSIHNQELTAEHVSRILAYWEHCLAMVARRDQPPRQLLSDLSLLTCYLDRVNERELALLLAVAPYVTVGYHADDFIEQLARLAPSNPPNVANVLGRVLDHYKPSYDFQDRLKKLIRYLANQATTRLRAVEFADMLVSCSLPGALELFRELRGD